jgi:hypothetical protein
MPGTAGSLRPTFRIRVRARTDIIDTLRSWSYTRSIFPDRKQSLLTLYDFISCIK